MKTGNHKNNPYKLDLLEEFGIAALTQKNSNFVEGILAIDSRYKKSVNGEIGSSKYWVRKMLRGENYSNCLKELITAIDKEDGIHLKTTKNGIAIMYDVIKDKCPTLNSLKTELKKPFSKNKNHLIKTILESKNLSSLYLSFASKFCAIVSTELGMGNNYSKYDKIVSSYLPKYYRVYIGEKEPANTYKAKHIGNREK